MRNRTTRAAHLYTVVLWNCLTTIFNPTTASESCLDLRASLHKEDPWTRVHQRGQVCRVDGRGGCHLVGLLGLCSSPSYPTSCRIPLLPRQHGNTASKSLVVDYAIRPQSALMMCFISIFVPQVDSREDGFVGESNPRRGESAAAFPRGFAVKQCRVDALRSISESTGRLSPACPSPGRTEPLNSPCQMDSPVCSSPLDHALRISPINYRTVCDRMPYTSTQ